MSNYGDERDRRKQSKIPRPERSTGAPSVTSQALEDSVPNGRETTTTRLVTTVMDLVSIKAPSFPTRERDQRHVESLAIDIAEHGLLVPPVVDTDGHTVAGNHRIPALLLLQGKDPVAFERWFPDGKIPVVVVPYSAAERPDQAIDDSVRENAARTRLSRADMVFAIKARINAGARTADGRPARGEIALRPWVVATLGVSEGTAKRLIREAIAGPAGEPDQLRQFSKRLAAMARAKFPPGVPDEVRRHLEAATKLCPVIEEPETDGSDGGGAP